MLKQMLRGPIDNTGNKKRVHIQLLPSLLPVTPPPIPLSYVPLPPTCAPDGSDPFVASPKGATAMELAVLSGSAKIVRRFESKALFAGDVDVQVRGARAPCGRHGGRPGVEMSLK